MTCNHWTATVDKALRGVDGAKKVSVTLKPRGAKIDTIDQVAIAAESGTAAAGTSAAETTTAATTGGLSTGTKIAIGAGAAVAVGGVAAITASTGEENGNGENGGGNSCQNPPQLISSSPPDGATNILVSNRTISFTFDQKMNVQHWSILFPGGTIDAGNRSISWSSDGKTFYFVYNTDLPAGRVIEWILNASGWGLGFRNDCEIPLPADQYRGSFTTANF